MTDLAVKVSNINSLMKGLNIAEVENPFEGNRKADIYVESGSTKLEGKGSVIKGGATKAVNNFTSAGGLATEASGVAARAGGILTTASGVASSAGGIGTEAVATASDAKGFGTKSSGFGALSRGCGTLSSGNFAAAFGDTTVASGYASFSSGVKTESSSYGSFTQGYKTEASGISSHAEGWGTIAEGLESHCEGFKTVAKGICSHVEGSDNIADGNCSHVEGYNVMANGLGVHAMGGGGIAFNKTYSWQLAGGFGSIERISKDHENFLPGVGISSMISTKYAGLAPVSTMDVNNLNVNSGYARYFEWADGNPRKVDRIGYFVQVNPDGKLEICNNNENVVGVVVSDEAGIITNSAPLRFNGATLKDKFGRSIVGPNYKFSIRAILRNYNIENIDIPEGSKEYILSYLEDNLTDKVKELLEELVGGKVKLLDIILLHREFPEIENIRGGIDDLSERIANKILQSVRDINKPTTYVTMSPNYDPLVEYVPRNQRQEWVPIGILGAAHVRDNGLCQVGKKCDCNQSGIAIPGNTYRVIARHADDVVEIILN